MFFIVALIFKSDNGSTSRSHFHVFAELEARLDSLKEVLEEITHLLQVFNISILVHRFLLLYDYCILFLIADFDKSYLH